jgi:membrane-bound ClpP family serine protease
MFDRFLRSICYAFIQLIFLAIAGLGAAALIFDSSMIVKVVGGIVMILFSFLLSYVYMKNKGS